MDSSDFRKILIDISKSICIAPHVENCKGKQKNLDQFPESKSTVSILHFIKYYHRSYFYVEECTCWLWFLPVVRKTMFERVVRQLKEYLLLYRLASNLSTLNCDIIWVWLLKMVKRFHFLSCVKIGYPARLQTKSKLQITAIDRSQKAIMIKTDIFPCNVQSYF